MYVRNPADRVKAVAPWLTLDTRPVPGGRGRARHLDRRRLHDAGELPVRRADVAGRRHRPPRCRACRALPDEEISYIRNSVKATVDAYDGTRHRSTASTRPTPCCGPGRRRSRTWSSRPRRSRTACGRTSATRRTMFKVQRELLTEYHVDTPGEFFSTVSFWDVPSDPTVQGAAGDRRLGPAAVLPAGRAAEPGGRDVPADQRAGQPGAAVPLGVRVGELRSGELREDHGAGAAGGDADARSAAGAGPVPRLTGGQPAAEPVAAEPDHDRVRQPAHPPGGGRPALRRAGVHRAGGAERVVPGAGPGAGQLQRPGRLRARTCTRRWSEVFGAGAGTAVTAPGAPRPAGSGRSVAAPAPANADQAAAAAEIQQAISQLKAAQQSRRLRRPGPGAGRAGRRRCSATSRARPPRPRRHRPRHRAAEAHPTPRG